MGLNNGMKNEHIPSSHARAFTARPLVKLCIAALLAASGILGCRGPSEPAANSDIAGTYALKSVNGSNVPCALQHQDAALTVKSGSFTITADGACFCETFFALPSGKEASKKVEASYAREGSTLKMKWKGAGQTVGTVESNAFTMNNEGMIFAYRK
jgi:hypothetical protein